MAMPVGTGAYDSLHITIIQDKTILNEIGGAVSAMVEKVLGRKMAVARFTSSPAFPAFAQSNPHCQALWKEPRHQKARQFH